MGERNRSVLAWSAAALVGLVLSFIILWAVDDPGYVLAVLVLLVGWLIVESWRRGS